MQVTQGNERNPTPTQSPALVPTITTVKYHLSNFYFNHQNPKVYFSIFHTTLLCALGLFL